MFSISNVKQQLLMYIPILSPKIYYAAYAKC